MKIGVFGRGRLGSAIASAASSDLAWQVGRGEVPSDPVDVLIDVSTASAVEAHLTMAIERNTPLVIGSTGWSIDDLSNRIGDRIAVLTAPNFSLTVVFLRRLVQLLGRFAMLEANARILGAVLNGVRAMAGGYLRKNYEAFYDYRERQPLPAS